MEEVFVLRVRIKFAKYDTMRFIGHLDVMRYFQKLFNRANLPIRYTEGFHPHQILSFAQPLGLGITSDGEYLDFELTEEMTCEQIVSRLNEYVTHGFEILEATRLNDRELNRKLVTAMSLINRSVYLIILKDSAIAENKLNIDYASMLIPFLTEFLSQKEIRAVKQTKKGEKEVILSDHIYEVWDYSENKLQQIYVNSNVNTVIDEKLADKGSLHAPDYENNRKFIISLSAGSENNINPELFLQSFLGYIKTTNEFKDTKLEVMDFRIHRMELLGGELNRSTSLCQIP